MLFDGANDTTRAQVDPKVVVSRETADRMHNSGGVGEVGIEDPMFRFSFEHCLICHRRGPNCFSRGKRLDVILMYRSVV